MASINFKLTHVGDNVWEATIKGSKETGVSSAALLAVEYLCRNIARNIEEWNAINKKFKPRRKRSKKK